MSINCIMQLKRACDNTWFKGVNVGGGGGGGML